MYVNTMICWVVLDYLQKVGFEQQDLLNIKMDLSKIKDLEYLKQQNPAGPFRSREEIENFMERVEESKQKNDRLYVEVRYARNTCLSMSNSEKFFKLRRYGKTLESLEYAHCSMSNTVPWQFKKPDQTNYTRPKECSR